VSTKHPNKAERARLIEAARLTVAALEALPILTPCADCLNFMDGHCSRWDAPVPEEARVAGCGEWQEQIPF